MMENEKDILQEPKLKKMPYSIPEGYFEKMKAEARKCAEPAPVHISIWTRLAPYAGIAAMFLFILTLGKLFVGQKAADTAGTLTEDISTYEDYLVFSDIPDVYLNEPETEAEGIADEDIIEYLIYIGATIEDIEYDNE
jgi:hypothetical protein